MIRLILVAADDGARNDRPTRDERDYEVIAVENCALRSNHKRAWMR